MDYIKTILDIVLPESFDVTAYVMHLLVAIVAIFVVAGIFRLSLGKGSMINGAIASAVAILTIYVITVPGAVVTGLRQVKTAGVDDLQGNNGVDAAVVFQHVDVIAVDGCGSGQQVVLQVLLRHVLQITGVVDDGCIARIVLDQAQDIGCVDVVQYHRPFRIGI